MRVAIIENTAVTHHGQVGVALHEVGARIDLWKPWRDNALPDLGSYDALVAFGGEWFEGRGGGVFAETWFYDPARDAWTAGPAMRTPRHGLAAASVDGTVYALGGGEVASGGKASGLVEALSL